MYCDVQFLLPLSRWVGSMHQSAHSVWKYQYWPLQKNPCYSTICSRCIATKTQHLHTCLLRHPLTHTQRVVYHWVFVERLHFPFEQQWSPAETLVRRLPRILATTCRSEGGLPVLRGAVPSDPVCPGRWPANAKTFTLWFFFEKDNYIHSLNCWTSNWALFHIIYRQSELEVYGERWRLKSGY